MGLQYVHLPVDTATATQVGRREAREPVILRIRAAEAHAAGMPFYRGNDLVWLADAVGPEFIEKAEARSTSAKQSPTSSRGASRGRVSKDGR